MEPFTALLGFLATVGAAIGEGAAAIGEGALAIGEGALEAGAAIGEGALEAGTAIKETVAHGAGTLADLAVDGAKDFASGLTTKGSGIVSGADGSVDWGSTIPSLMGKGVQTVGISKIKERNNSNGRRILASMAADYMGGK